MRLGNFNLIFHLVEVLEKFIEDHFHQIYIFQETLCKSNDIKKKRLSSQTTSSNFKTLIYLHSLRNFNS